MRAGQRLSSMFSACSSCFSSRIWSSTSSTVKLDLSCTSSAWMRRMRPPIEWKVPSHGMPSTAWPSIWPSRSFISRAALLVKVTERISLRPRPALAQDVGDARGQHAGLAGAGAGQHQNRAVQRLDRLALLGIEAVEILRGRPPPAHARRCRQPRAGARGRRDGAVCSARSYCESSSRPRWHRGAVKGSLHSRD